MNELCIIYGRQAGPGLASAKSAGSGRQRSPRRGHAERSIRGWRKSASNCHDGQSGSHSSSRLRLSEASPLPDDPVATAITVRL